MDELIKITIMCLFFLSIILILYGFSLLFTKEKIYSQTFWWDTYNGLNYSTASFNKLKYFPFIKWISFDVKYKHPKEHSEFGKFKELITIYKKM